MLGIEACGNSQWFIELLEHLGHLVWVGDAAQIRASYVRKQKTDRRDAGHILRLLMESRFPRLWVPTRRTAGSATVVDSPAQVGGDSHRVKNGLQHLALNRGVQKHSRLWSVRGRAYLEKLPLEGWTARRREDLLKLLAELDKHLDELDEAASRAAEEHPQARLLMTQPGVGPITSLAFVLTIGDVSRFQHSNQVASYLGLIPREHSSGGKQRLGSISKQGNRFMRQLLVESVQTVNRLDEGFRKAVCGALPPQAERRGQGGGGQEVGSATLLDVAAERWLSRDRPYREQPAGAPERRKPSRDLEWALSHPAVGWMSAWKHHGLLLNGRIDGWWGAKCPPYR